MHRVAGILIGQLINFLKNNLSLTVSVCAVLISFISLIYTINSQKNDLLYREILIRPSLNWHVDSEAYTIKLRNDGLGPAAIKGTMWRFGSHCFRSMGEDPATWHKERAKFEDYVNVYFLDEIAKSFGDMNVSVSRPATYAAVPTPGELVPVGQSVDIFGIDEKSLESFSEYLRSRPYQIGEAFRAEFIRRATVLQLSVAYCSASDRYCAQTVPTVDLRGCKE